MPFCTSCGQRAGDEWLFCRACGQAQGDASLDASIRQGAERSEDEEIQATVEPEVKAAAIPSPLQPGWYHYGSWGKERFWNGRQWTDVRDRPSHVTSTSSSARAPTDQPGPVFWWTTIVLCAFGFVAPLLVGGGLIDGAFNAGIWFVICLVGYKLVMWARRIFDL